MITTTCSFLQFAHVNTFTSSWVQSALAPSLTTIYPVSGSTTGTPALYSIVPTVTGFVVSTLCPNFLATTFTWILWHVSHSNASITSCSQSAVFLPVVIDAGLKSPFSSVSI